VEPTAAPKPLPKWLLPACLAAPALLIGLYVVIFQAATDNGKSAHAAEGERAAEQGVDAEAAFRKAIALAPKCEHQDFSDDCTLSGKIFLSSYLEARPAAKSGLCAFAQGEPQGNARDWAMQRCVELGHAGQGCCRDVHRWLAEVCP
jgi:hypothetical protein